MRSLTRKAQQRIQQETRKRRRRRQRQAKRDLEAGFDKLPNPVHRVIGAIGSAFARPTLLRFTMLMVGLILATGNRTIAGVLRLIGLLAPGHASSYHRVFSRSRWNLWKPARALATLILTWLVPGGRVELAGDDTVEEHRGAKVFGKGCHRDAVRSSHSHTAYRWGHKWVVLSILVPLPFSKRRWALPVLVALYRPPKEDQETSARHKTPPVLMRQLVATLLHWFPGREFSLTGDGGYATHELAEYALRHRRRLRLISRFYADASLYEAPPLNVGKRPAHRPRKKGAKLPSPKTVVSQRKRFDHISVAWYGGGRREAAVVRGTGHWFKSGGILVPVLWVYVRDCTGTHRDEYFFTTDLSMTAAEVIECYTGRWSIETTFQEMRAHLGLETTRGRCQATVLRVAPCLFGLYSVVVLLYTQLPKRARRAGVVEWCGKVDTTFSDAIVAVRCWLWREWVFPVVGLDTIFKQIVGPLQRLILVAMARAA
jgi:DDE superfamily endonuclease/putative transposase ISC1217